MKKASILFVLALCLFSACKQAEPASNDKVIVAYVSSWTDIIPDPSLMTHINYAFGHVNDSFDGVRVDNPQRLHQIVALKKQNGNLKVMLSVGGWGSGRFSEMVASESNRTAFCQSCLQTVEKFGLDGIDIDWEYPTSAAAGISSSPADRENFTLLMRDLRKVLGDRLLTIASSAGAQYIDFKQACRYMDFVNIMAYDMANAPQHHSALYDSAVSGEMTSHKAVRAHINAGVPVSKIVLGVPFYGRKGRREFLADQTVLNWDSQALVPYYTDSEGYMVLGTENVESLTQKCRYALDNNLKGVMYWEYGDNDEELSQSRCIARNILGQAGKKNVLVLTEHAGQHGPFTDAALIWLRSQGLAKDFVITEINNSYPVSKDFLEGYCAIIQLDFPPYTWDPVSQEALIEYVEKGLGSWIGFHHATLLGEFDGWPMWDWFSGFMGDIVYSNYIAQLSDGEVEVEDALHPVMKGVESRFVLRDDEWYIYNKSPRPNVRVLATVNEDSYSADTDIKMGDHPVVWVNENVGARNVYFQMGHSPKLFSQKNFTRMFSNAIDWCILNN